MSENGASLSGDGAGVRVLHPLPMLTQRQARVLLFVAEYYVKHRVYPTNREVCEGCDIRSSNPAPFIGPLVAKGLLARLPGQRRNLRLTEAALGVLESWGVGVSAQLLLPLRVEGVGVRVVAQAPEATGGPLAARLL